MFNILALEHRRKFMINISGYERIKNVRPFIPFNIPNIHIFYRLLFKISPDREIITIYDDYNSKPIKMSIIQVKLLLLKILYYLPNNSIIDELRILLFKNALMNTSRLPATKDVRLILYNKHIY